MKKNKSHFNFNEQERSGIFFLLLLVIVLQLVYFGLAHYPAIRSDSLFELDEESQKEYDSLVRVLNSVKGRDKKKFNPNYISDFKGYTLGLSPVELDKLNRHRDQGGFVDSAKEFQMVTGVSDSLLKRISPLFKFPDWVTDKKNRVVREKPQYKAGVKVLDLNKIAASDLRKIHGIGEKLSARIIKFRDRLGGFLINEQLYDVYGLEPNVVDRTLKHFQVLHPPAVKKININTASADEMASLVYLGYNVAQNIVSYREENGAYTSLNDLSNVSGFPASKIERIGLYLSY